MTQKDEKKGRSLFRRPWFIAIAVVIGLGVLGSSRRDRESATDEGAATEVPATASSDASRRADRDERSAAESSSTSDAEIAVEAPEDGDMVLESGSEGAAPEPEEPPAAWRYWKNEDAMTGRVTRFAEITSTNEYELDFPYQGGTHAELMLREHPRHGADVIVTIDRGQLVCNAFTRCRVLVRFDERPPIKFRGAEAADHSNRTVFLSPTAKFIKQLRAAERIAVELDFFQSGTRVFFFDVDGLEWE
jgi:hypothetical protein